MRRERPVEVRRGADGTAADGTAADGATAGDRARERLDGPPGD
ncbi:hypothetical protein [Sorangium sp. So ce1335]